MQDYKFRAVMLNTGEILECETFAPIWRNFKYYVCESETPRIEIYIWGVHVSTIATRNGRIYYRRIGSLKQFDITELFTRFYE